MGMFDHYRPKPELVCPVCGVSDPEWQGKDGPCALFVWEQGQSAPVDQLVDDECKISPEDRAEIRLPARFEIYTDCRCPTSLDAVGFTEHGVWTRTELLSPTNAVAYPDENEGEFRKRLAAFVEHPGHRG
jgi:hypothetical protein